MSEINGLDPKTRRELYKRIGRTLPPSVSYQQRGDYWYGFFRYGGRVHTVYIGKDFREVDDPIGEIAAKKALTKKSKNESKTRG